MELRFRFFELARERPFTATVVRVFNAPILEVIMFSPDMLSIPGWGLRSHWERNDVRHARVKGRFTSAERLIDSVKSEG